MIQLFFLLAVLQCPAATLVYNVQFTTPLTGFSINFSRTIFQVAGPTPTLSGTLNPGDQFQLVYSAPSGFLFSILPLPSTATLTGFFADFWTEDSLSINTEVPTGTVSFTGATTTPPAPSTSQFAFGDDNRFRARVIFPFTPFSFRSITATFTVPQGYSRTFNNFTPGVVRVGAFYDSEINLGPAAALIPDTSTPEVPEPATILLVPGTLALLATRNFRQRCRPLVTRSH